MEMVKSDRDLVLKIENITFGYKKGKNIYENFSLNVYRGECVGVVGSSGIGKSTLFELIANNLKPLSGTVEHQRIGWIFQDPYSSFHPSYRVVEQIDDVKSDSSGIDVEEFLDRLNLSRELIEKFPHQLSGGELQRCSILRALMMEPDILLSDEATSALDNITQLETMKLLIGVLDRVAILLITHDLSLAEWACDYIVNIEKERVGLNTSSQSQIQHRAKLEPKAERERSKSRSSR
jgi:peptide/nickel transport system ATP-binding protein